MSGVKFTLLKRIFTENGDVLRGLKSSELDFEKFGEAYFSFVKYEKIKGWKLHKKMDMNLLVPVGDIQFHIYDENNEYQTFRINKDNYGRLMIPAGHWVAFEGKGKGDNVLLNIASIEHDPTESLTMDISKLDIK